MRMKKVILILVTILGIIFFREIITILVMGFAAILLSGEKL
jgi:hypothetical protein